MYKKLVTLFILLVVSGCSSLTVNNEKDIYHTVFNYCSLDYEGKRLQSNHEWQDYITWDVESGWDHFTVVEDFTINAIHVTDNTAIAQVEYTVVGEVDGAQFTQQASQQKTVKFSLNNTTEGWRIDKPLIPPHVSLDNANRLLSH